MTSQSILEAIIQREKERDVLFQKTFPYKIDLRVDLSDYDPIILRWCEEQFGKQWGLLNPNGIWTEHLRHVGCREWHFKNEKDAVLFALRWV